MMDFVSWDDDIPIYEMENIFHVPNYIIYINVYYIYREIQRSTSRNQICPQSAQPKFQGRHDMLGAQNVGFSKNSPMVLQKNTLFQISDPICIYPLVN